MTLDQWDAWGSIIGGFVAVVVAVGSAIYARFKAERSAQRVEDRLSELEKWKDGHEAVATNGIRQLTTLKAGMSDGAERGFQRVERAIEQVLEATNRNATQIGEVSGQLRALTTTVSQLVSQALTGTH